MLALLLLAGSVGLGTGGAAADPGAPVISGLTPISYDEGGDPVQVAPGIEISGGSFADGFIEFAIPGATAQDRLFLPDGTTPSTVTGEITVIGTAVHLGLGDGEHKQIGTVDEVRDGQEGRALRVNFSAALPNSRFSDGVDANGHPLGWTVNDERLVLGTDVVSKTQARALSASSGSSAPFTINGPGYSFTSDRNYRPSGDRDGWAWEGVQRDLDPGAAQYPFEAAVVSGALRLFSQDNWCVAGAGPYCSVFGPDAWSSPFTAKAGDDLAFDWSAANGKDDYEVYGFLVDEHGTHTELMYGRGFSQPWITSAGQIPADGTYRFRFLSGTYDSTGGRQVGASLYIDNVRVLSSDATSAVAQAVGRLVHYEHTGQNPPSELTIGVSAETGEGPSEPVQIPTEVTLVDDGPVFAPVAALSYLNTAAVDSFVTHTGAVSAVDPEGDPVVYSLGGGQPDASEVDGAAYSHSVAGRFGTLHLNSVDGSYAFVPNDAALEALAFADAETFTIHATANGLTDSTTLEVAVDVEFSVPGAPTGLTVERGDREVTLGWDAPVWTGGREITDHVIEVSDDGGVTWTTAVASTGSSDTTHSLTGLDAGDDLTFRVAAVNAEGAGPTSDPVTTTVITVPAAPTITKVTPGNRTLTVEFADPASDGGAPITHYEWSADGGVTWTRVAASDTSTIVIRPLVNNSVYPVQVRAVNAAGTGPLSNQVAASPVAAPVLPPTPGTPAAPTGTGVQIVDGEQRPITMTRPSPRTGDLGTPAGTLRFADGPFSVDLLALDEEGSPLELDAEGRLVIVAGAYADVSGEGFRPGTTADVWLMSTPILLGEVLVGPDGTFSARLPIPDGIQPGPHTIQLNGVANDGSVRTLSVGVVVRAAAAEDPAGEGGVRVDENSPSAAPLAFTGSHAVVLSLLGLALLCSGVTLSGVRAGIRRR